MKHFDKQFLLGLIALVVFSGSLQADNYSPYYVEGGDAQLLEKQGDYVGALALFKVDLAMLSKLHEEIPTWEPEVVAKVLNEYRKKITTLEPLAIKQIKDKPKETVSLEPPVSVPSDEALAEGDLWKEMNGAEKYLTTLQILHQQNPEWQTELLEERIKKSEIEMEQLETLATKKAKERMDSHQGHAYQ